MRRLLLGAGSAFVLLALPLAASAQTDTRGSGAAAGATTGAVGGAIVGGPVGAVIGGAAGALVGGLAEAQQPQFRQYVVTQGVPSYRYAEPLQVGAVLPQEGVRYYEIPAEYGATQYRYTVVNETPVIVDPRTRRVVQVVR